jgi:hypothetical protein
MQVCFLTVHVCMCRLAGARPGAQGRRALGPPLARSGFAALLPDRTLPLHHGARARGAPTACGGRVPGCQLAPAVVLGRLSGDGARGVGPASPAPSGALRLLPAGCCAPLLPAPPSPVVDGEGIIDCGMVMSLPWWNSWSKYG